MLCALSAAAVCGDCVCVLAHLAAAATTIALLLLLPTIPQALPHGLLCTRAPEQEKASTEHISAAAMARRRRAMIASGCPAKH